MTEMSQRKKKHRF